MRKIFGPLASRRTWSETLHLLLDLPLGISWFTIVVTGLSLGGGLVVLALIGLAILAATVMFGRLIGVIERARARALLSTTVTPPPRRSTGQQGAWKQFKAFMADVPGWKGLAYGLLLLPVGIFNFTVAVTLWSIALAGTTYPLWGWAVTQNDWHDHVVHGWVKAG
ncbi:MAG TPA: sensor domain-containing protein, partial [Ilumatobacteraceae bacterium]|nr:sensor domain-containing protein [Ilumatobacteraceae bacterium]